MRRGLFRIIRYEWGKLLSDRKILFLILIGMFVSGATIWNICGSDLAEYKYQYNYNQETIDNIVENAKSNMDNSGDVTFMKEIQSRFSIRKWNYNAYNSREKDYCDGTLGTVTGITIAILFLVSSFELERTGNMNLVIYTVSRKTRYAGVAKILALLGMGVMIQVVFFLEDLVGYAILGGINPFLKLYLVPGYITTWYSGNILTYKLLLLLFGIFITALILILLYFTGLFIKDSIKLLCCGLLFFGALFKIGLVNVTGTFRNFGMTVLFDHIFFRFEIIFCGIFLLTVALGSGVLLVNARRGRL